jgi:hypothetical protein
MAKALVLVPVPATHVPVPEKLPVTLLDETVAIVTDPASSAQMKLALPLELSAMNKMTSVQDVVLVDEQFGSMFAVPTVCRLMTMPKKFEAVELVAALAATLTLPSALSFQPVAHDVVCAVASLAVADRPPVALYVPPPPPV